MATINFILQGKGGVGKTFIASLMAQSLLQQGITPVCIDADPSNPTLSSFTALKPTRLDLMEGDDINPRTFDELVESIEGQSEDAQIIIDNGSSSAVPLISYLITNDVAAYLTEAGHKLRFHCIIAGGQNLDDTNKDFVKLCHTFPDQRFVVWKNAFFGKLERDGKEFEDIKSYKDNVEKIDAIITLKSVKKELFGVDIEQMLKAGLTFQEAIASPDFSSMSRQRLKLTWQSIFAQLQRAGM